MGLDTPGVSRGNLEEATGRDTTLRRRPELRKRAPRQEIRELPRWKFALPIIFSNVTSEPGSVGYICRYCGRSAAKQQNGAVSLVVMSHWQRGPAAQAGPGRAQDGNPRRRTTSRPTTGNNLGN